MSKCYDNPDYDDLGSDIQNTWEQHVELINDNIEEFDKAIKLFKQETLEEKLDKIVSKEPSKFWKESDERFENKETLEEAKYKAYKEYWNENHTQEVKSNFLTAFKLGAKWNQENILELLRSNGYDDEPIFDLINNYLKS